MRAVILFIALSAVSAVLVPQVQYPYSTTLLRTHHYASEPFLSIAEEMSAISDDTGLIITEAYYIFPSFPFSMRDANDTHVNGIRAIFETNHINNESTVHYFLTSVDGVETCVKHKISPLPSTLPVKSLGDEITRGIVTKAFSVEDSTTTTTKTYYTEDLVGMIPFRLEVTYPAGGAEIGYLLDHGTHFPRQITKWFDVSGCAENEVSDEYEHLLESPMWPRPTPHPFQ